MIRDEMSCHGLADIAARKAPNVTSTIDTRIRKKSRLTEENLKRFTRKGDASGKKTSRTTTAVRLETVDTYVA